MHGELTLSNYPKNLVDSNFRAVVVLESASRNEAAIKDAENNGVKDARIRVIKWTVEKHAVGIFLEHLRHFFLARRLVLTVLTAFLTVVRLTCPVLFAGLTVRFGEVAFLAMFIDS